MIEFFIVKTGGQEPFYSACNDICFASLDKAWNQIRYLSETNKDKITDYYIVRILATDLSEIVNCFWAAANGQGAKIKSYKILNLINISEGD